MNKKKKICHIKLDTLNWSEIILEKETISLRQFWMLPLSFKFPTLGSLRRHSSFEHAHKWPS